MSRRGHGKVVDTMKFLGDTATPYVRLKQRDSAVAVPTVKEALSAFDKAVAEAIAREGEPKETPESRAYREARQKSLEEWALLDDPHLRPDIRKQLAELREEKAVSENEAEFDRLFGLLGDGPLPEPVKEYRPHPTRRWRIDRAWPTVKLAVEIEGGVHRIGDKFERDVEKYNWLTANGWRVLRCTPSMLRNDPDTFFALVEEVYLFLTSKQ
jgi:very-short-patch-repair endonuclease